MAAIGGRTLERIRAAAVRELAVLASLENNVEDREALRRNAATLQALFEKRGFVVRILETPTGRPAVLADLAPTRATGRTVLVYSHYDGVPPGDGWTSDPYSPMLRDDAGAGAKPGPIVPWPFGDVFDPRWRLVGRSVADSKGSIVAVLAAVDLLRALGEEPGVRLKVLLDGEEERESPALPALLAANAAILAADAVVNASGEVHPSGLPTINLGARGILVLEVTVSTASAAAHSGHFGNFVPNAALALSRLLASLKHPDGRVAVDRFDEGAEPLGPTEVDALTATPAVDQDIEEAFSIHRPEVTEAPWHHLLSRPTLNIRGLRSGAIGADAANVIPHRATAEIDVRLTAGMDPGRVQCRIEDHLRRAGATVLPHDPMPAEVRETPLAVTVRRLAGFPAVRTSATHPTVARVRAAVERATGGEVIVQPTEGGSLPLHLFQTLAPVILSLPISNYDNRQHAADENLQLRFLFRGIDVWTALLRWDGPTASKVPAA